MEKLDYDGLVQQSLRDVVRKALLQVSQHGLFDEHHFYITFRTDRPDVQIPQSLRNDHPEEVTIVLQHQFWDLEIQQDYFAVTLSFHGMHERLKVPFAALLSFMDPSVKFGLQFIPEEKPAPSGDDPSPDFTPHDPNGPSNVVALDIFRNKKK